MVLCHLGALRLPRKALMGSKHLSYCKSSYLCMYYKWKGLDGRRIKGDASRNI